jgi:hypothetical protein
MSLSFLFRPLLPTWRFFEDVGAVSVLHYRSGRTSGSLGAWNTFSAPASTRSLGSLFLNPQGNLELAKHALVERLAQELGPDVEQNVSYKLVKNLVRSLLVEGAFYQFKISHGSEETLVSPVYESGDRP